ARALAEDLARVEVRYDWEVERYEPEIKAWRLRLPGRADIVVTQAGALPCASVEIHTESTAGRKRRRPEAWSAGVRTRAQLSKALRRALRAAIR
ncbi:MAG: hypothetical protein DYH12_34895, partial [Sorangiineae bacterium PRO1]|nr:hypothetical protein [Sorangiineae bacterium PRO1]